MRYYSQNWKAEIFLRNRCSYYVQYSRSNTKGTLIQRYAGTYSLKPDNSIVSNTAQFKIKIKLYK